MSSRKGVRVSIQKSDDTMVLLLLPSSIAHQESSGIMPQLRLKMFIIKKGHQKGPCIITIVDDTSSSGVVIVRGDHYQEGLFQVMITITQEEMRGENNKEH